MKDFELSAEEVARLNELSKYATNVEKDTSYSTSMCVIGDCWGECRGN